MATAVREVTRQARDPEPHNWKVALKYFQYFEEARYVGQNFSSQCVEFAECVLATIAMIVDLFRVWCFSLQAVLFPGSIGRDGVCSSTSSEAEYESMYDCHKDASLLRTLLRFTRPCSAEQLISCEDNGGAGCLPNNTVLCIRTTLIFGPILLRMR